jgi:hypothetical protein
MKAILELLERWEEKMVEKPETRSPKLETSG